MEITGAWDCVCERQCMHSVNWMLRKWEIYIIQEKNDDITGERRGARGGHGGGGGGAVSRGGGCQQVESADGIFSREKGR